MLKLILRVKGRDRIGTGRFAQHIADHRQYCIRLLLNQRPRNVIALRHPRAVIEQRRCRQKRRKVDGHRYAAEGDQPRFCGVIKRFALGATKEFQPIRYAEAEPGLRQTKRLGAVPGWIGAAVVVARIFHRRQCQQLARLFRRGGKEGHAVQGAAGRHHPGGGE